VSTHPLHGFNVFYEVYDVQSIHEGGEADSGEICIDVDLRTALSVLGTPARGFEANCSRLPDLEWITAHGVNDDTYSNTIENRSLHFPKCITRSSRMRVCRFLRVYGTRKN
jgi:hypothetical protein